MIAPSVGETMQGEELPWVRGTYWVVGREWSPSYIFRAWLRLHPGHGAVTHIVVNTDRQIQRFEGVAITLRARAKALERYLLVSPVRELDTTQLPGLDLPVVKKYRTTLRRDGD